MPKRHCWNCLIYRNCKDAFKYYREKFPVKKCIYHEYNYEFKIATAMDSIFNPFIGDWF